MQNSQRFRTVPNAVRIVFVVELFVRKNRFRSRAAVHSRNVFAFAFKIDRNRFLHGFVNRRDTRFLRFGLGNAQRKRKIFEHVAMQVFVYDKLTDINVAARGVAHQTFAVIPPFLYRFVVFPHIGRGFAVSKTAKFIGSGVQIYIGIPHKPTHEPKIQLVHFVHVTAFRIKRIINQRLGNNAEKTEFAIQPVIALHDSCYRTAVRSDIQGARIIVRNEIFAQLTPTAKIFIMRSAAFGIVFSISVVHIGFDRSDHNYKIFMQFFDFRATFRINIRKCTDFHIRNFVCDRARQLVHKSKIDGRLISRVVGINGFAV